MAQDSNIVTILKDEERMNDADYRAVARTLARHAEMISQTRDVSLVYNRTHSKFVVPVDIDSADPEDLKDAVKVLHTLPDDPDRPQQPGEFELAAEKSKALKISTQSGEHYIKSAAAGVTGAVAGTLSVLAFTGKLKNGEENETADAVGTFVMAGMAIWLAVQMKRAWSKASQLRSLFSQTSDEIGQKEGNLKQHQGELLRRLEAY
jgi:hypothetical protein